MLNPRIQERQELFPDLIQILTFQSRLQDLMLMCKLTLKQAGNETQFALMTYLQSHVELFTSLNFYPLLPMFVKHKADGMNMRVFAPCPCVFLIPATEQTVR